jgi:hypothetical protein
MNSNRSKNLNAVDVVKLIMAFCVIGIHSYIFDNKNFPTTIDYIVNLAVPFFIITSGWLYTRKYGLNIDGIGKLSVRYFRLYFVWVLIYLPLILFEYYHSGGLTVDNLTKFIRKLLLTGSNPFSYHLWYILAMATACLFMTLFHKLGISFKVIWLVGLILMFMGFYFMRSNNNIGTYYRSLFEGTGNGLTMGLGLFTTGMMLYKIKKNKLLIASLFLVISIFLYAQDLPYWQLLGGSSIFLFSENLLLKDKNAFEIIRTWSIWIYYIHMYPVFVVMSAISLGWLHITRYEGWFIASFLSFVAAFILNKLANSYLPLLQKIIK